MNVENIRRLAVIGAGLMGHGIAQEFAAAGYEVALHDLTEEKLHQARVNIQGNLAMLADMGLGDAKQIPSVARRVHCYTDLKEAVDSVQLVIECVSEDLAVKHRVFRELDEFCPPAAILASNTSSLLPSRLASVTKRPDRVLVTHYFNPPYLIPFVEVVRGSETAEDVITTVFELLKKVGKSPVIMQKEAPGFIGNRLQAALFREALSMVERGIASPQDVDLAVKNGFGRRLAAAGVFQLLDIAGWDTVVAASENIFPDIESSRQVSALVGQMVKRGELGVKTGKGIYSWTPESATTLKLRIAQTLVDVAKRDPDKS